MLGICRGMELLNVSLGGDLVQHLPDVVHHDGHRAAPGRFSSHDVRVAPGSLLAKLLGGGTTVNSLHHQGPGKLGRGLLPVAWAPDGSVEAIEVIDRRFAIGVLWHPEQESNSRLFEGLVGAARAT
jgi:gamma-glutamyl-gamma-aminobutyrate hydrolase PuuD